MNVAPPFATAQIDTRLLPGERIDQWVKELRAVIQDEQIRVEPILTFEAIDSPVETEMVERLREVVRRRYPGAIITYPVTAGFTDSHHFRRHGIKSYGLSPFLAPPRLLGEGFHGHDERIGRRAFVGGVGFLIEFLDQMVRRR